MSPGRLDLHIYRGDTGRWRLSLTNEVGPVDLTGSTFEAQVRKSVDGVDVLAELTVDPLDLPGGVLELVLPPAESALVEPGCAWDLQMTAPDGDIRTLLAGQVCLRPDVTRP